MEKALAVKSLDDIKRKKLKIHFSDEFLKGLLSLVIKDSKFRTLKTLRNVQRLMGILDDKKYDKESEGWVKLELINLAVDAILEHGISGNLLKLYIKDNYSSPELVDLYFDDALQYNLSEGEITYVLNTLSDRLSYAYIVSLKDALQNALDETDDRNKSYKAKAEDIFKVANVIQTIQRETQNNLSSCNMFSLRCDKFDAVMDNIMDELQNISKCYITGIRRLNSILGGGFLSDRLYCYLAFPAGGKSLMLLTSAIQIKKYNHVEPEDVNKTPAILLLTMENTVTETVARLFNMTTSNQEMSNVSKQDVKQMMRDEGGMIIDENGSNMDIIIKYFKVNEISTTDIYTIVDDLKNDGYEIKVILVDYLKRIRCSDPKVYDEKNRLKNNTNELKGIAIDLHIPVITAHQLNRNSASVVDNALQSNKIDVTRLIGRDGIGDAWEINENCDWICILNKEIDVNNREYMAFKLLKRRYKSLENNITNHTINYFAHPFDETSGIKLIEDVRESRSASVASLGGNTVDTAVTNRGRSEFVAEVKDAFSVVDFTNDEGLQM